MPNILKKIVDFNNSAAFNKSCKLVYFFMQAMAVGISLGQLRGYLL
jgi:hypothetical protein